MVSLFKTDGRRGEHVRFASDEEKEEKQITQKRTMRMDADGCGWIRMDPDGWFVFGNGFGSTIRLRLETFKVP